MTLKLQETNAESNSWKVNKVNKKKSEKYLIEGYCHATLINEGSRQCKPKLKCGDRNQKLKTWVALETRRGPILQPTENDRKQRWQSMI